MDLVQKIRELLEGQTSENTSDISSKSQTISLIAGLGNVGKQYENTRHNAGFMFLNDLSENFKVQPKLRFFESKTVLNSAHLKLIKPTTYMNESGIAVRNALKYYGLSIDNIAVAYDDLDLELGTFKIQFGKMPRVHNGVNSIVKHLKTDQFLNIRIGIDARSPEQKEHMKAKDYVLSRFSSEELVTLRQTFIEIKHSLNEYV